MGDNEESASQAPPWTPCGVKQGLHTVLWFLAFSFGQGGREGGGDVGEALSERRGEDKLKPSEAVCQTIEKSSGMVNKPNWSKSQTLTFPQTKKSHQEANRKTKGKMNK